MSDVVLTAIITGIFSIITAFIAAYTATHKTANEMRINQAVTNTKIDLLKDEVQKHNNFAMRMPAVEEQLRGLDARLKTLERKGE